MKDSLLAKQYFAVTLPYEFLSYIGRKAINKGVWCKHPNDAWKLQPLFMPLTADVKKNNSEDAPLYTQVWPGESPVSWSVEPR